MVISALLKETERPPCDIRKRDLQKITQDVFLADLDKDVVNFVPNFDETEKEPEVLPVRVPNLLGQWCRRHRSWYGDQHSYP